MWEIDFDILSFLVIDGKCNKFLYLGLFSKCFDEELNKTLISFYLLYFLFDLCFCLANWNSFDVVQEEMFVELRDAVIGPNIDELCLQFDVHCF